MFQTKVKFSASQTSEQRKAHADHWRREDARRRGINNALGLWRACGKPQCRRNRTCSGDMHACFARLWPLVPEEQKEFLRGCITAARDGDLPADAIHRAGLAARDRYLNERARLEAPFAQQPPAESTGATHPAADVRTRRL